MKIYGFTVFSEKLFTIVIDEKVCKSLLIVCLGSRLTATSFNQIFSAIFRIQSRTLRQKTNVKIIVDGNRTRVF